MPEREQPVRMDHRGEWVGNAEDLSQINSALIRIQATATAASATTPKVGNGGVAATGQTGTKK